MMWPVSQLVALVSLFGICLALNASAPKWQKVDNLLDTSWACINKAKKMYSNSIEEEFECGEREKSLAFLDVALNMINQVKKDYPDPEPETPMDCGEILRSGKKKSGVYSIWPRRSGHSQDKSLSVYCDMDTDGGGWTVIQRRGQFSTPKDYFYKDWADYKKGFGNIEEEFWIGNDNIYAISNQANYSIRFDLKDAKGETGYAVYDHFRIEDEAAQYTLRLGTYSGNVGNSMVSHRDMKFSTKDRMNGSDKTYNCAVLKKGAWWYNFCSSVNLNGLNQPGVKSAEGIDWVMWRENVGLSWVEMKLRA